MSHREYGFAMAGLGLGLLLGLLRDLRMKRMPDPIVVIAGIVLLVVGLITLI
jgi:hypothetical protein